MTPISADKNCVEKICVNLRHLRMLSLVFIHVHPWFYSLAVCTGTAESGVFLFGSWK